MLTTGMAGWGELCRHRRTQVYGSVLRHLEARADMISHVEPCQVLGDVGFVLRVMGPLKNLNRSAI